MSNKTANMAKRYRELIDALGMTQIGAASFFDIGNRTSRRWASGQVDLPLAVLMLLEIMVAKNITPHDARKLAGAPKKRAEYFDHRLAEPIEE